VRDSFEKTKEHQAGTAYDLIVFSEASLGQDAITKRHEAVGGLLSATGAIVGLVPTVLRNNPELQLTMINLPIGDDSEMITVGKLPELPKPKTHQNIVVVDRGNINPLNDLLVTELAKRYEQHVEMISLSMLTTRVFTPGTTVICVVELYEPMLTTLSETEMSSMKIMTDNAANILWIHGGGNIKAVRPDLAMVTGFSRSLVLEQPSLRFFTYDIDNLGVDQEASVTNILATLADVHTDDALDLETVQKNGIPFLQRFVPEEQLNKVFRQKLGNRSAVKLLRDTKPAALTIQSLGQSDTLAFKPEVISSAELDPDFVEVDVKSVGFNAKVCTLGENPLSSY